MDNPYPLLRDPYPSELKYFRDNHNVAGMATEDERVIFNPYSKVHPTSSGAIYKNEAARIFMRNSKNRPKFKLTDEQIKKFKDYGNEQDIRETIIGRLISGDSSSGLATPEQIAYTKWLDQQINQ